MNETNVSMLMPEYVCNDDYDMYIFYQLILLPFYSLLLTIFWKKSTDTGAGFSLSFAQL